MPFPFVAILVGAAVSAITAYGAKKIYDNWDVKEQTKPIENKSIVLIGGSGVGKTTLGYFLCHGSVSASSGGVTMKQTKEKANFLMKELNLKTATLDFTDVNGLQPMQWNQALKGANYVLYLAKAGDVLFGGESVEDRIDNELRRIKGSLDERIGFGVVLTFCDELECYSEIDDFYAGLEAKVVSDAIYKKMQAYFSNRNFLVAGSLSGQQATERMFRRILEGIKSV